MVFIYDYFFNNKLDINIYKCFNGILGQAEKQFFYIFH